MATVWACVAALGAWMSVAGPLPMAAAQSATAHPPCTLMSGLTIRSAGAGGSPPGQCYQNGTFGQHNCVAPASGIQVLHLWRCRATGILKIIAGNQIQ